MNSVNSFNEYLENKIQEFIKKNDEEILRSVKKRDKKLIEKIENFRRNKMTNDERLMNTTESILESITTNTMIRAHFRKDPSRQSVHETAQFEWIKMHLYKDVIKLNTNINGICIADNKLHIISKSNPKPPNASKTLDYYIPSEKKYLILKYTEILGGAQDNQRTDVEKSIKRAIGYLSTNIGAKETFAVYIDGAYYTPKIIKTMKDMIPAILKQKIIITSCASIIPMHSSNCV